MKEKETYTDAYTARLSNLLKLDYKAPSSPWLTSQRTLRRLIGVLGIALPLLLILVVYIDAGYYYPLDSISHYYYTRANSIFIIVVSLLAIFLLIYKGFSLRDFLLSSAAGICALLLILFPTSSITDVCYDIEKKYSITIIAASNGRIILHYVSAAIFLSSLATISIFSFTKVNPDLKKKTTKKKIRNGIYIGCGIVMICALLVIFMRFLEIGIPKAYYDEHHLTFWMEAIAVESFGISWLIKGKTLFSDN
jgi:hypothetical protein